MDYVIKGYTGQDNVQVSAVLNMMVNKINQDNPTIKDICIQIDNISNYVINIIIYAQGGVKYSKIEE